MQSSFAELISVSRTSRCHSYHHRCLSQWSALAEGGDLSSKGRSGPQGDYLKPSKIGRVYSHTFPGREGCLLTQCVCVLLWSRRLASQQSDLTAQDSSPSFPITPLCLPLTSRDTSVCDKKSEYMKTHRSMFLDS